MTTTTTKTATTGEPSRTDNTESIDERLARFNGKPDHGKSCLCADCCKYDNEQPSDPAELSRGEHTPTPWRWIDRSEHSDIASADSEIPFGIERVSDVVGGVEPIADICNFPPATPFQTARQRANAEYIVLCVNSHSALVAALETIEHPNIGSEDAMVLKKIAREALRAIGRERDMRTVAEQARGGE